MKTFIKCFCISLFCFALLLALPIFSQGSEGKEQRVEEVDDQPARLPSDEPAISTQSQVNQAGGRVYVYYGPRYYRPYRYRYYKGYPYRPYHYRYYYYPYQRPYGYYYYRH
ncbi:MAG: hypothetical protein H7A36_06915 [Chlamydiales bacterium]|nr:hypothetical protein [Chlamydiales bacterium]